MIMDKEQFKIAMQNIAKEQQDDCEVRHANADDLICAVLSELGYHEGIEIYKSFEKWYA